MDVQTTKVLAKFLLFLRTDIFEVLVPKDDNAAFCYQECELVFLSIA